MQRLRVRFSRGEELKFISHLDLMRCWGRLLRRSELPVAYSQGYNPQLRLSLAAPLALGVTSEAELMELHMSRWLVPRFFINAVRPQLPQGLDVLDVLVVPLSAPSLQSQVRFAEYRVEVEADRGEEEVRESLRSLLSAKELSWQHQRDTGIRRYDLRALIDDLWLIGATGSAFSIGMRLRFDNTGAGRPEQVAAALGFKARPRSIHRTKLVLKSDL